jgi:hypothetical protein
MSPFTPVWIEHQRRRFTRCNAHLWQRPIAWSRPPQPSRWPTVTAQQSRAQSGDGHALDSLVELRRLAAGIKHALVELVELRQAQLSHKYNYDPSQLRVPAGNLDGGQWTRVGTQIAQSGSGITIDTSALTGIS